jgi:hypothetical protein
MRKNKQIVAIKFWKKYNNLHVESYSKGFCQNLKAIKKSVEPKRSGFNGILRKLKVPVYKYI